MGGRSFWENSRCWWGASRLHRHARRFVRSRAGIARGSGRPILRAGGGLLSRRAALDGFDDVTLGAVAQTARESGRCDWQAALPGMDASAYTPRNSQCDRPFQCRPMWQACQYCRSCTILSAAREKKAVNTSENRIAIHGTVCAMRGEDSPIMARTTFTEAGRRT